MANLNNFVGTQEAADLLGVSRARVSALLKHNRIKGAQQFTLAGGSVIWMIPKNAEGLPEVLPADGCYKGLRAAQREQA